MVQRMEMPLQNKGVRMGGMLTVFVRIDSRHQDLELTIIPTASYQRVNYTKSRQLLGELSGAGRVRAEIGISLPIVQS